MVEEGWAVLGIDIEDMFAALNEPKPDHFDLVLEDIRNIRGADYAHVQLIVGSSPCQDFSWRAMPWTRARTAAGPFLGLKLFHEQFRIQREICEAAGRFVPMVVENVRGAIPWVGRSRWHYGSYHVWGDVPALMPEVKRNRAARLKSHDGEQWNVNRGNFTGTLGWNDDGRKNDGGSWFAIGAPGQKVTGQNPDGRKVPGFRFDGSGKSFQTASVEGVKVPSAQGHRTDKGNSARFTTVEPAEGRKHHGDWFRDPTTPTRQGGKRKAPKTEGIKMPDGTRWFNDGPRTPDSLASSSSSSPRRKAASAKIAKIPEVLSRYIGWYYHPDRE